MRAVSGGFTFHAWVYLSPPLSLEAPGALRKRMLYYFGAPNGAGFQAFFRNSGTLVIATVTRKGEFINLCLQDSPLTHSTWVSSLHCEVSYKIHIILIVLCIHKTIPIGNLRCGGLHLSQRLQFSLLSLQHSVCISHSLTQRLWGHSEVNVFVDGRLVRTEKMRGPELQEVLYM